MSQRYVTSSFRLHPSSLKKSPAKPGFSVSRSDPRSGTDPYQAPGAFDRAGAVRPLDVSLVTDYGLDYAVGTLEQTERTQKIHARTHRDLRTTRIEQATKG